MSERGRHLKNKITIATRESLLALWQAKYVAHALEEAHPGLTVELFPVTTKGDQILDRPLVEIGGKGLFIKELEVILLEGKADIAVHSLKDMTAECPKGLTIAAVTKREDPRDGDRNHSSCSSRLLREALHFRRRHRLRCSW